MPDQKRSILIGALVTALLSTSYFFVINCLCCAGVIIGAMTAVWHYTESYQLTIEPGRGAVMGLIVAALGAILAGVLNYLLALVGLGANEVITEAMMGFVESYLPPEQLEMMREQMAQQQQPSFGAAILGWLFSVVLYGIFGAIGGAIGASVFKKGGDTPAETW